MSKGLEVLQNAVKLVITNRYVEAEAILRDKWVLYVFMWTGKCFRFFFLCRAKDNLYHGVGYALIVFIQAALSFDRVRNINRVLTGEIYTIGIAFS